MRQLISFRLDTKLLFIFIIKLFLHRQKFNSVGEGSPLPLFGIYTLFSVGRGLAPAALLKSDFLQRADIEIRPYE